MGSVVVAEIVASEARHAPPTGHVSARQCTFSARTETPLYAFSRAIDRESLAGLNNSLKLVLIVLVMASSTTSSTRSISGTSTSSTTI